MVYFFIFSISVTAHTRRDLVVKVPRVKCGSEETRSHQPETGSGDANSGEEKRGREHVVSCQETLRGTRRLSGNVLLLHLTVNYPLPMCTLRY